MGLLLTSIFGSRNTRFLKKCNKVVSKINMLEDKISAFSDNELQNKTEEFKKRYNQGETLEQLLPEAFAVIREAAKRVWNKRPYDVQLIGGMTLHQGKIAEMRTGEGKTITATLSAYLNALSGNKVHIITVNEYLAQRDSEKMGELFSFLGLKTSCLLQSLSATEKKEAYNCNIIYGTNSEFGFDYLRDNMAFDINDKVQTGLDYVIIDEVDSILIDEARTPLIISGQSDDLTTLYQTINVIPPQLTKGNHNLESKDMNEEGDYGVDIKSNRVLLTEKGVERVEEILKEMNLIQPESSLYDTTNITVLHHLNAALKAYALFHKDQHYVVRDDTIFIVDEHTGRIMEGRRWNDGIHQAIEAKENVTVKRENVTLATITLQNYFKLYKKLSGMTGTADTEAFEFSDIYNLETIVIPTHRPLIRKDFLDEIYLNNNAKNKAILSDLQECMKTGQPVLIGTNSIEKNEYYSDLLNSLGIEHQVLNAKQHEKEASIIAQAGKIGMITIATNMAGRGTDIILGGNIESDIHAIQESDMSDEEKQTTIEALEKSWKEEHKKVVELGGLHIIGTERNENRRIDNQFRGRAGRQGDPGSSRFFLSMEDPLLKIFSGDRAAAVLKRMNMKEEDTITHPLMSKALQNSQKKLENHHYNIRKDLLEYDNVANAQRKVVYGKRNEILNESDVHDEVDSLIDEVFKNVIDIYIPPNSFAEFWDLQGLDKTLQEDFRIYLPFSEYDKDNIDATFIFNKIVEKAREEIELKKEWLGETFYQIEKRILLDSLDLCWREHLYSLDYLRQGINLRSYAQKDPKQEYRKESYNYFQNFVAGYKYDTVKTLLALTTVNILQSQSSEIPEEVEINKDEIENSKLGFNE